MNFLQHLKQPELVPLFAIIGAGGVMSSCYLLRLATKGPEVTWKHHGNPEPWQIIAPSQRIKLMGKDLSSYGRPAPDAAYAAINE